MLIFAIVMLALFALYMGFNRARTIRRAAAEEQPPAEQTVQPPDKTKTVQPCILAGQGWYPADPETIAKQLKGLMDNADTEPRDDVIALILPHAGYAYSARTAAYALKAAKGNYKRIIVIGPTHQLPMEEVLSVPIVTHYQSPLGQVPLDTEFIAKLLKHDLFQNLPRAHLYEHSVQIELPLLQKCFADFSFVPIVAGRCSENTIKTAAQIIRSLIDAKTLVIASSDFVHYGQRYGYVPFTENIPDQLNKLDMGAFEYIKTLDAPGFLDYRQKTGATICGAVPIAIVLSMLDKTTEAHLAHYTTSGALTGDYANSVSYLSVFFTGAFSAQPPVESDTDLSSVLTDDDKHQLLLLARKTIEYFLEKRDVPTPADLGIELTDALLPSRAAFVTLEKNSQLRGCIGDIFPQRPLYKSVIQNAIHAAVNDRRFAPVTAGELAEITVEISALTQPKPVASYKDISIGIDGVVLNKNGRAAVFLPHVAPEQGWNLDETLKHLSVKAGLPPDAYKEGATFLVFQAEVFGEEH